MSKFQLTISADYVPTWGVYEGIREVIQNALDGAQDGFRMEITPPTDTNRTLQVRSHGAQLDRSVWLMGTTTKSDGNHRGCYGEGLKLAALALARASRKISIANGDEDWRVKLEPSKTFEGRSVVTVYTVRRQQAAECFTVRVECSPAEWAEYSQAFLDLRPHGAIVKGGHASGDILLDPALAGHLFIKGILVEKRDGYFAGYNFHSAQTDRDRRMVSSFDLGWYTSAAWSEALLSSDPRITPEVVLNFLIAAPQDADAFRTRGPSDGAREIVTHAWRLRFGDDAIPVANQAGVDAAGHFGRTGVLMPAPVISFFQGSDDMDLDRLRANSATTVTRAYEFDELQPMEAENLRTAVHLISAFTNAVPGLKPLTGRTAAAEFSNPDVLGLAKNGGGKSSEIFIARRCLASLPKTFEVLTHEAAHDIAGDGSAHHQRAEGALFSQMVATLIANVPSRSLSAVA